MIILSVPYKNYNSIPSFTNLDIDLIEYRFDYCEEFTKIDWNKLNDKSICTIRDIKEGGKRFIPDSYKKEIINIALSKTKAIIDCEYRFLKRNPDLVIPENRLMVSLHHKSQYTGIIRQFMFSGLRARYYKLAVSTPCLHQFLEIVEMIPSTFRKHYIIIPLHPLSISSRLVYKLYFSKATYVFDKIKLVSNQPSVMLANLCRIDSISIQTVFYLIVGGKQILQSLSFYVYNTWFKSQNIDSVLLPIEVKCLGEAIEYINWLQSKCNVKGVIITMPFKKEFSAFINNASQNINSWILETNAYDNTDEYAMKTAMEFLGLQKKHRVLIFGTGATSQMTQKLLKKRKCGNVDIWSHEVLKAFEKNHDINCTEETLNEHYDLLINCSPFGLIASDNADKIPHFDRLIDLPYGNRATTLIKKAISEKVDYIDGFTFWKWQAIEQSKFFGFEDAFREYIKSLDLHQLIQ